jgi:glycosyltransferase involved in cell wall biosynthesis
MTTVESMQNMCVPIVIDGGGQREIVEHGCCGFRFKTMEELCRYTVRLLKYPALMKQMSLEAYKKGKMFGKDRFEEKVRRIFLQLEKEYCSIPVPDPREVIQNNIPEGRFHSIAARLSQRYSDKN